MHRSTLLIAALLSAAVPALARESFPAKAKARILEFDQRKLKAERLRAELSAWGDAAVDPAVALIEGTEISHATRLWLLEQLVRLRPEAGERRLLKLLGSTNDRVPRAVFTTLGRVGTERSVPRLLTLLGHRHMPTSFRATGALVGIFQRRGRRLPTRLQRRTRKRLEELIEGSIRDPKAIRWAAVSALPRLFGPAAFRSLIRLTEVDHLRSVALRAFLAPELKPERYPRELGAFRALRSRLQSRLRRFPVQDGRLALRVLGQVGDLGTLGWIVEFMTELDERRRVAYRKHAFFAMRTLSGEAFTTLDAWSAYWERVEPVYEEYDDLLADLEDGEPAPAVAALEQLKLIRDRRLAPAVHAAVHLPRDDEEEALYGNLPLEPVTLAAIKALELNQVRGGLRTLILLVEHPRASKAVRRQATWALGRIAGKRGPARAAHWVARFPGAVPELEPKPSDDELTEEEVE